MPTAWVAVPAAAPLGVLGYAAMACLAEAELPDFEWQDLVHDDFFPLAAPAAPVLVLAHRRLVRPAGMRFGQSFGLVPVPGGVRSLGLVVLALLGVGQLGEGAMDFAGRWLGLSSHWTEWFDPDLAWGPQIEVAATIFDTVVLTPVFEEIIFRGLLFATLRRRFATGTAAVLSASIFAIAHGSGVLGFAAVFWSGLLWAFAYERTGSLLPSMAAHAADNLMASIGVVLILRG